MLPAPSLLKIAVGAGHLTHRLFRKPCTDECLWKCWGLLLWRGRGVRFQQAAGLSLLVGGLQRKKVGLWRLMLFTVQKYHHGSLRVELLTSILCFSCPTNLHISFFPCLKCKCKCYALNHVISRFLLQQCQRWDWNCSVTRIFLFLLFRNSGFSLRGTAPCRHCTHQACQGKLQSTIAKEELVPLSKQETKRFVSSLLPSC